ncbi:hypothetical protein [Streptomyces sp. NPDC059943]|uniref:hypothetical protein n=1 Tax=Streptomyces sp. NPDC059943 TaxID=3347010 RepID=UPI0036498F92
MGKKRPSGRGQQGRTRGRKAGPVWPGQQAAVPRPEAASPRQPEESTALDRSSQRDATTALIEEIRQAAADVHLAVEAVDAPDRGASELELAWRNYGELVARHAEMVAALTVQVDRLGIERSELDTEVARREKEAEAFQDERDLLDARTAVLERREGELDARGRAAELGFMERRLEAGRELETWLADERRQAVENLEADRDSWRNRWAETERRLTDAQAVLDRRESDLAQRERELVSERARLAEDREDVAELRSVLKEQQINRADRLERELGERTGQLAQQLTDARRRVAALTEGNEGLSARLSEQESALVALGGMSLEQVVERITQLRADNARLAEENAAVPHADARLLGQMNQQVRQLASDNEELVRERGELESLLQRDRLAVNERENYLEANNWLRAANNQLQRLLSEEAAKLNATAEAGKDAYAFPSCSLMDRELMAPPLPSPSVPELPVFVERMQAVIRQRDGLSYRASDLRLVLAGMAMSRLHLYQGISGIGKTGLGRALAGAFGSPDSVAVVPVQAGWRDPQDLMGYYNSFDRTFYESEFTKALYRAQCTAFKSRPFFIVLDEMNLSHPEQYFSGVLSALAIKGERKLALTTAPVRNPPELLIDGTHIAVPDNVWFIGTANHDETTLRFADKTYDRSFVMELPWQHPDLPETTPLPPESLGHRDLTEAFSHAQTTYAAQASDVIDFLDGAWRSRFAEDLRIGWGNRLELQIRQFVPVVVAAGGSPGEALDHLLATRILRSVRGRYDINEDALDTLRTELGDSLRSFDAAYEPEGTQRLLDDEIRSRGRR